jgi:hypothetical protein
MSDSPPARNRSKPPTTTLASYPLIPYPLPLSPPCSLALSPKGVEGAEEVKARQGFLRQIGYKVG